MKTKHVRTDWLIPLLGIALVAGGVVAAATYYDLERKIHADEAFATTLDRLFQNQQLSAALKTLHDGDAGTAAQRLDLLLCDNILMLDSELACADERKAAYVKDTFRRIARVRPKNSEIAAGAAQELESDRIEAEKILMQACAGITGANEGDTALR
jgi:hypothetical protein